MKRLLLYGLCSLLATCSTFDSVGFGGTYTDEQGRTFGGTVQLHVRDGKQVVR